MTVASRMFGLFWCAIKSGKKSTKSANIVQLQCYKNEIKVAKNQIVIDF